MTNDKKPLLKLPAKMGVVAQVINNIIDRLGEGGVDFTPQSPLELTEDRKLQLKQDGIASPLKLTEEGVLILDTAQMKTVNGISVVGQGNINTAQNPFCVETNVLLFNKNQIGREDSYIDIQNILSDGTVNNKTARNCTSSESIVAYLYNNTHAYVGTIFGTGPRKSMKIKQLDDNDYYKFADGTDATDYIKDIDNENYNVFVRIPTFYYKVSNYNDGATIISFKLTPDAGYIKHDENYLIGAYTCSTKLNHNIANSISDSNYNTSSSIMDFVNAIDGLNNTYMFRDNKFRITEMEVYSMLYYLFIAYYGYGNPYEIYYSENVFTKTGNANELGKTSNNDRNCVKFFGLEGIWGNIWEYVSNLKIVPSRVNDTIALTFRISDEDTFKEYTVRFDADEINNNSVAILTIQYDNFYIPRTIDNPQPGESGRIILPTIEAGVSYNYLDAYCCGMTDNDTHMVGLSSFCINTGYTGFKKTVRLSYYNNNIEIVNNF